MFIVFLIKTINYPLYCLSCIEMHAKRLKLTRCTEYEASIEHEIVNVLASRHRNKKSLLFIAMREFRAEFSICKVKRVISYHMDSASQHAHQRINIDGAEFATQRLETFIQTRRKHVYRRIYLNISSVMSKRHLFDEALVKIDTNVIKERGGERKRDLESCDCALPFYTCVFAHDPQKVVGVVYACSFLSFLRNLPRA